MPLDDNQGGELDLNSIVNDALAQDEGGSGQTPQTFTQDRGQGELLSRTQQPPAGQPNQPQGHKLYAGKYKTPEEVEKAYQNVNKLAGQRGSKLQQLEAIIQNPRFQQMAANDPEVAQALAKAGYELRQAERAEDMRGQREWDGNENDPEFRMALIDAKNELRWALFGFGQERGRALAKDEERAIREVLQTMPRLIEKGSEGIKMAWKLTPFYEKELKAKEDERFSKLQTNRNGNRPRPNPTTLAGQKLNLQKPVTEMNDAEKRAYLADIVDKNS